MTNTPLTAGSDLSDLVTFTDFADTVAVVAPTEEAKKSNMDVWMEIIVKKGSAFPLLSHAQRRQLRRRLGQR